MSGEVRPMARSQRLIESSESGVRSKKKRGNTDFHVEQIDNYIRICEYLSTDPLRPTPIKEIQEALNLTYNKTLWALHNGKAHGWIQQVSDNWCLGPRLARLAEDVRKGINDKIKQYTGGSNGKGD